MIEEMISSSVGYGATGGAMGLTLITQYGPVEQFKQQYVLRDAVIRDSDVYLIGYNTEDMQEIAKRLDTVFEKVLTPEQKEILMNFLQ